MPDFTMYRTADTSEDGSPRPGWLADTYDAFKQDRAADLHDYLRRLCFARWLYLTGKING